MIEPIQVGKANLITVEDLKAFHARIQSFIKQRLSEFRETFQQGDEAIFEELVFCILAGGASAMMGLKGVEAVKDILMTGTVDELSERLKSVHIYPQARAQYIVDTRNYLMSAFGFQLRRTLMSFSDAQHRRDFIAGNKRIRGVGYKVASHFLRNIGFAGYAILDKHILRSLHAFAVINSPKPPSSRRKYLEIEARMKAFAVKVNISIDELDFVLWASRTGVILK